MILKNVYNHVQSSSVYSSQDMEATKMSIDGWMGKQNGVYSYQGDIIEP
jgi:hypothetical protein